jgi:hypothetical protein
MLTRVVLTVLDSRKGAEGATERAVQAACDDPPVAIEARRAQAGGPAITVDAAAFLDDRFDFYDLDARVDALADRGAFALVVHGLEGDVARAAAGLFTRCQRHAPRLTRTALGPTFARLRALHRALHDRDKPLVRADYAHALDTWQWLVRLAPDASLAAQAAALLHDVERLASEPDERIEHHAPDYQAFKDRHAADGARMTELLLEQAGFEAPVRAHVAELVAHHEQRSADPELSLLNDADALSFFTLNSVGYLDYFGPEQTRRKVAYSLRRMRPAARARLATARLRLSIREWVAEALDELHERGGRAA